MQRLCWLLTMVFVLATATLLYLFVIRGETLPASDGRKAVLLAPGERDTVLAEMRAFLERIDFEKAFGGGRRRFIHSRLHLALQEPGTGILDQFVHAFSLAAQEGLERAIVHPNSFK